MEIGILPRVRSDRMRMNLASEEDFGISKPAAVSYTHLTLPTNREV